MYESVCSQDRLLGTSLNVLSELFFFLIVFLQDVYMQKKKLSRNRVVTQTGSVHVSKPVAI